MSNYIVPFFVGKKYWHDLIFQLQFNLESVPWKRREGRKMKKAVVGRFTVLKGVHRQLTPMRIATQRCAGECTCKCCKWAYSVTEGWNLLSLKWLPVKCRECNNFCGGGCSVSHFFWKHTGWGSKNSPSHFFCLNLSYSKEYENKFFI